MMPTPHDVIVRLERDYAELLRNCQRSEEIANDTIQRLLVENKRLQEQLNGAERV